MVLVAPGGWFLRCHVLQGGFQLLVSPLPLMIALRVEASIDWQMHELVYRRLSKSEK